MLVVFRLDERCIDISTVMKHPGVKCAQYVFVITLWRRLSTFLSCLLDIVGARFHCAICDSVDICANCESAGLPGNLDSADGGHTSSHILIKVCHPSQLMQTLTLFV